MMEDKKVFVDTNILIYSTIETSSFNQQASQRLGNLLEEGNKLWISRQIVREFLAVLSRPEHSVSPDELVNLVNIFPSTFHIAEENSNVTSSLLRLFQEIPIGGKQIHDANIVATMQVNGITQLITHNISDFRRFSEKIEILPLI